MRGVGRIFRARNGVSSTGGTRFAPCHAAADATALGWSMPSAAAATAPFEPTEAFALRLDDPDPLARYRERFVLPRGRAAAGSAPIYFTGNSLGLMTRAAREAVQQELDDWAELGVEAHLRARTPWFSYHEFFSESLARLAGAGH